MRLELVSLLKIQISTNPIELDDYSSNSYAVYCAANNEQKLFIYFKPDEMRATEPRCDYILVCDEDKTVRFIELKGSDLYYTCKNGCKSEWQHAFHQLLATYEAYTVYIDSEKDLVKMLLCTSAYRDRNDMRRSSTRYKQYKYYKKALIYGITPSVLYRDEIDEL